MFDRSGQYARAGKLVVTVAAVAVDPTGLAATAAGIDAYLEIHDRLAGRHPDIAKLSKEMQRDLADRMARPDFHRPADAHIHLPQMLEKALPDPADFVTLGLDADAIFGKLRDRLRDQLTEAEQKAPEMLAAFDALYRPALRKVCDDPRLKAALDSALTREQMRAQRETRSDIADLKAMVADLKQHVQSDTALSPAAQEMARRERLVLQLARNYAEGNADDFDGALRGLENALEVAARQRARLSSNLNDAVAQIIAEVDRLNDEGAIEEAGDYLRARMAEQRDAVAQAQQGMERLIEAGIAQAVLERDVDMAVELELEKLRMDAPEDGFDALLQVQDFWYERGRDRGLRFELEVSIALARKAHGRARDADQRGAALNELGIALATLGERESNPARLEQAVEAFQATLQEWTRDRAPLDWATAQNNLGTALATRGARENDPIRLEQAADAYRTALQEWTRDSAPLEWAAAQNNLGDALRTLGEREGDPARLEQAVTAFTAALQEWTRDSVPLDWAAAQNNLGAALQSLGERVTDSDRLEQAVDAHTAALEEWTRYRVPLDWATAQNNLGTALQALAAYKSDSAWLEQAVEAYTAALLERTRDRVPLDWALTKLNLGSVEKAFFDQTGEIAHLDAAEAHARAARAVFAEARATQYVQMADHNLKLIADLRAGTA